MLTPDYLATCTNDIVRLYQALEDEIIRDIVRRIMNTDFEMTQSAVWQMEKIQQAGVLYDDAIKQIAKITHKSEKELKKLFEDAGTESLRFDDSVYKKAGLNPLPLKLSPSMLELLTASTKKCNGELKNLTLTTAVTSQTAYIQACDFAYMKVASGAFDYNTAIKQAVQQASSQGLNVLYPSGHISKLDVAIRRSTLTGVSQTCGKLQIERADEMECDLVETTAHMGARPTHANWQGQVFSRSGRHPSYPDFVDATGYGSGDGLMGWNCRHNFYPFFEGISERAYTSQELRELAEHKVTYKDNEYTDYEASQIQRKMERSIRATKREIIGIDTAMKETSNQELKNVLQADFNASSVKLKARESKLNDFLTQTGRGEERARLQVQGFGKSQAQKATWANKKEIDKYSKIHYNKDGTVVVTDNWKDKKHPAIPKTYKPNAIIETKEEKGDNSQTNRTFYDDEAKMSKQAHGGAHGTPKKHPYGNNGEHAHDYKWDGNKIIDRKTRELTDDERKENADIL